MDTPPTAPVVRFGLFEVDVRNRELRKAGLKVRLQEQPFEVLEALLERAGQTVTREELRAKIWPADTFVDFDVGLNTAIKRLREALGDTAENPRFVETKPRRGYRFIAPVERLDVAAAGVPSGAPSREAPATSADVNTSDPSNIGEVRATRPPRAVGPLIVGLAATTVLAIVLTASGWRPRVPGNADAARIQSLAVLPLENLSHDPEQEFRRRNDGPVDHRAEQD